MGVGEGDVCLVCAGGECWWGCVWRVLVVVVCVCFVYVGEGLCGVCWWGVSGVC